MEPQPQAAESEVAQVTANFQLDRDYFAESYGEWLATISWYRRRQRVLGLLLGCAGIAALALTPYRAVAVVLLMISVAEWIEFYWMRHRWIGSRLSARAGNPHETVRWIASESGIEHSGPTSSGHFDWKAVKNIVRTRRGAFLRIGDGMSIYVPERALLPPSGMESIVRWHLDRR